MKAGLFSVSVFRLSADIRVILPDEILDAPQRLFQIFIRIGKDEAKIALSHLSEGRTGNGDDPCLFDEFLRKGLRTFSESLDIDKSVETPLTLPARKPGDPIDSVDEQVSAARILSPHLFDRFFTL